MKYKTNCLKAMVAEQMKSYVFIIPLEKKQNQLIAHCH